jgi:ribonuclease VapC
VIIDSSAIIAILRGEPEEREFSRLLAQAGSNGISAANFLETAIQVDRDPDPRAGREFDRLLVAMTVEIHPVSIGQARLARAAYRDFGKGSGHPARLNFGDCFSYALAVERDEPLLYKGDDFGHTDVRSALDPPEAF